MPRPRRRRNIGFEPDVVLFKPAGTPAFELETVILKMEELEAIRLKDFQEKDQAESAEKMGISQPTFHRLLLSARKKIADALVNGKAIKIEGGHYEFIGSPSQRRRRTPLSD
ncbi:MAG: DUF134 domain-containing protein [Candidatus Diapherotrites archaeon]